MSRSAQALVALLAGLLTLATAPSPGWAGSQATRSAAHKAKPPAKAERAPRRQVGKASIYHHKFAGRRMANGKPMRPNAPNAASKTLPLGTTARVTNLETGQSTVVKIEDRGPYVEGRIVDLSPASARDIGLTLHEGLATVEVTPIEVPGPVGSAESSRP